MKPTIILVEQNLRKSVKHGPGAICFAENANWVGVLISNPDEFVDHVKHVAT